MTTPRNIVFDIGGVLLRWDMRNLYRKLFADEARMEWFLANVCTTAFNLEQDRGRPFDDAVAQLVAQHPEWRAEIEAYHHRWPEMLDGEVPGTADILRRLQAKGAPTWAITNFSREKFDVARTLFPFLNTFRGTLVSGDEKLIKPDAAIFRLFLSRYGLDASDCVFVDDSLHNVEAARALGFHALHFTDAAALEGDLQRLGVL